MKNIPAKIIFIGAGPSSLFAARRLKALAKSQNKTVECVFLERELDVGGKCCTYSDPDNPMLKTEKGAGATACNYGVVIDALVEHEIDFEQMLPLDEETIELKKLYNSLSVSGKITFINKIVKEIWAFNSDYEIYQRAKKNRTELSPDLLKPFNEYARLRKMDYLPLLLKPLVPGFGYGALSHCPTYSALEYLGKMTIPDILLAEKLFKQPPLLAIHGGFQLLMKKIAENFDVRLGVKITEVKREPDKVTVNYQQDGISYNETADVLVLGTSPKNWPSLNLDLTETEKKCINQLEYYRYPVVVYKIKGLPPKQFYFPQALEEEGFGKLALITSRDNRKDPDDGRLCSIYINLPPNDTDFVFDHKKIEGELQSIEGVTDITVVEEKIWEDYMSTLPWDTRLELDKEQQKGNTVYLGSYVLGAFEDVVCVANKATDTMNELFSPNVTYEEDSVIKNVGRAWQFFTKRVYDPLDSLDTDQQPVERCSIQ